MGTKTKILGQLPAADLDGFEQAMRSGEEADDGD
jgi:hypothetical protein